MRKRNDRVYITTSFDKDSDDLKFLQKWSKDETIPLSATIRQSVNFRRKAELKILQEGVKKEMRANYPLFADQNRDN